MKAPFVGLQVIALLGAMAWMHASASAQDDGKLRDAIQQMAKEMETYLKNDAREESITLGTFSGPPQLASSAGASIRTIFTEELEKAGIKVKPRAKLGCKGEYFFQKDEPAVTITASIVDGAKQKNSYERKVYDITDIASILGPTGKLSVGDPVQRKEDLKQSVDNPQPELKSQTEVAGGKPATPPASGNTPPGTGNTPPPASGNTPPPASGNTPGNKQIPPPPNPGGADPKVRVGAAKGSQYGVEVWVKTPGGYQRQPLVNDEGLTFVDLKTEDIYAVRLINATQLPAAVTLTIDGLNMFTFSEIPTYRQLGKVIIPPNPEGFLIKGWHLSNEKSAEFHVVEYAQSEAVLLKLGDAKNQHDEQVGTITASFAVAVPPGTAFPKDEPLSKSLGTKRGAIIGAKFLEAPMQFGQVREVISVRYNRPLPPPQ